MDVYDQANQAVSDGQTPKVINTSTDTEKSVETEVSEPEQHKEQDVEQAEPKARVRKRRSE